MTAGIDWTEPDVPLARFPARDLPHWVDCPPDPADCVPAAHDPYEREGLWVVVYRDDGGVFVVEVPLPATVPVQ